MNKWTIEFRKQGCEIFVSNDKRTIFIGDGYECTPKTLVKETLQMAQSIVDALNKDKNDELDTD